MMLMICQLHRRSNIAAAVSLNFRLRLPKNMCHPASPIWYSIIVSVTSAEMFHFYTAVKFLKGGAVRLGITNQSEGRTDRESETKSWALP